MIDSYQHARLDAGSTGIGRRRRPKLKYWVGLCGLLFGLSMGTRASAQTQDSAELRSERAPQAAARAEAESTRLGYLLLGTSCALGLGMLGLFLLIRRRHRRRLFDFEKMHFDDEYFTDRVNAENILGAPRSIIRRMKPPADDDAPVDDVILGGENLSGDDVASPEHPYEKFNQVRAYFQGDSRADRAESIRPEVRRRGRGRKNRQSQADDPGLDRLVCSGCDRRYRLGAQFCYHDGLPLMQDTARLSHHATSLRVCKECGWESTASQMLQCPHDGCDLVELDAANSTETVPTIPMMVCPSCGQLGAPGQTFCAVDGELLSPLINTRAPELPLRGFGPRRKVCTECGAEHGGAASFCSQDGSPLVVLN